VLRLYSRPCPTLNLNPLSPSPCSYWYSLSYIVIGLYTLIAKCLYYVIMLINKGLLIVLLD